MNYTVNLDLQDSRGKQHDHPHSDSMLTVRFRSFAVVLHGLFQKHFWYYCEIVLLWSKSVTVLNTAAVGPRSGGVMTSWTVWNPTC